MVDDQHELGPQSVDAWGDFVEIVGDDLHGDGENPVQVGIRGKGVCKI